MNFVIQRGDSTGHAARLIASSTLTADDFQEAARQLGTIPEKARKSTLVWAEKCTEARRVDTFWNGQETTNYARHGDWIVTNLDETGEPLRDKDGKTYVIDNSAFGRLYERTAAETTKEHLYERAGIVQALLFEDGFDICGPWGERQVASSGYLILSGDMVYGNNAQTFRATYKFV
jgi:hypothetical protein